MLKVRIQTKCQHCDGQAYLPDGEGLDSKGNKYLKHKPCRACEGSGTKGEWVDLPEFLLLLEQAKCSHERVTTNGGFHLSGGEVWDDIKSVCSDCGELLI